MGRALGLKDTIVIRFEGESKPWAVYKVKGQGSHAKTFHFIFLDQALEYVKRLANQIEAKRPNGEVVG